MSTDVIHPRNTFKNRKWNFCKRTQENIEGGGGAKEVTRRFTNRDSCRRRLQVNHSEVYRCAEHFLLRPCEQICCWEGHR